MTHRNFSDQRSEAEMVAAARDLYHHGVQVASENKTKAGDGEVTWWDLRLELEEQICQRGPNAKPSSPHDFNQFLGDLAACDSLGG